jgi:hypothetical protein
VRPARPGSTPYLIVSDPALSPGFRGIYGRNPIVFPPPSRVQAREPGREDVYHWRALEGGPRRRSIVAIHAPKRLSSPLVLVADASRRIARTSITYQGA